MAYALLAVRLLVGIVFAASATGKLRGAAAFRGFEESARSMGVPARLSRLVAVAVVVGSAPRWCCSPWGPAARPASS